MFSPACSTSSARAARVSSTIGSSHISGSHELLRRTDYRRLVSMFTACSNDAAQHLSVSDVLTIPREKELHSMNCCQGDVTHVGESFHPQTGRPKQDRHELLRFIAS